MSTTALPSDQDLIAFIKKTEPTNVGFLAYRFKVDRELMRDQLRRLKDEGKLKSESVKYWKANTWHYATDWRVA